MATKAAQKRLNKEYVAMQKDPPPFVWANPEEKNILNWHFIIRGPPDSPFAGGEYHGVLLFPSEYPFKPPGIKMFTPSGRFHPDKKICFSMSDFHPASWNPAWSVATILTGLLSFMLSDEMTTGSVTSSDAHKRVFAARSHVWNIGQKRFAEVFPDFCTPTMQDLPNMGLAAASQSASPPQLAAAPPPAPSSLNPPPAPPATIASSSSTTIPKPITAMPKPIAALPKSVGDLDKPSNTSSDEGCSWAKVFWNKWQWGVLIVFAVVVSRLSSSGVSAS